MKMLRHFVLVSALLAFASPSYAQWQTPDHSVPIGRGGGVQGFKFAAPQAAGTILTSNGPGVDPTFQPNPTVGTVTSVGGSAGIKSSPNPITTSGTQTLDGTYAGAALQNCSLQASVTANTLTVALKDAAGADPTTTSPCNILYRNSTVNNGSTILVQQTAALSINTYAVGATLGSTNGAPFRFWVVSFNNDGTNVLALINCTTGASILPLNETTTANSVGMSGTATSAGVFYTPNGTAVAAKSFRILGYVQYSNGLTTAGSYDANPTSLRIATPGMKRPGDTVQTVFAVNGTTLLVNNTTPTASSLAVSITPTSTTNAIRVLASGIVNTPGAPSGTSGCFTRLGRNSNANLLGNTGNASFFTGVSGGGANTGGTISVTMQAYDFPASASAISYAVYVFSGNTLNCTWLPAQSLPGMSGGLGSIEVQEIQG